MMDKKYLKGPLIFIGGVLVLLSANIPLVVTITLVVDHTENVYLALFIGLVVCFIYLMAAGHVYGKYIIYPNEESPNGS